MTVRRNFKSDPPNQIIFACDGAECEATIETTLSRTSEIPAARKETAAAGWKHVNLRRWFAYCPACPVPAAPSS
ncbi:MAG TPA: hypothetical protein VKX28_19190 [Xanthobacteraceae bacterium]|jgi:hypothetical protein|nr:hypothetical protein [Xanthobacteraceae bacterium]